MAFAFNQTLSLRQAANLIATVGQNVTVFLRGEPGIGKSSILKMLKEKMGAGYDYIYLDAPTLDQPDLGFAVPDKADTDPVLRFHINEIFNLHGEGKNRPKVILVDELSKITITSVKLAMNRLMLDGVLLGQSLPEGSIVCATGNLTTDGVGDALKAHDYNRVVTVDIGKPSNTDWMEWAIQNDIDPVLIAFAKFYPQAFESYTDYLRDGKPNENPYIFDPKTNNKHFLSPRSLAMCSPIVKGRSALDADAVMAAIAGTIGVSGARDLHAYILMADKLHDMDVIEANPTGTPVPDGAAQTIMVFKCAQQVTKKSLTAVMTYIKRFPLELQAVFANKVLANEKTRTAFLQSTHFSEWVSENHWLTAK